MATVTRKALWFEAYHFVGDKQGPGKFLGQYPTEEEAKAAVEDFLKGYDREVIHTYYRIVPFYAK